MMKVSVIIPNYNHARYLRQRIDSVLNQTYQDFELIILDDCSTDSSRAIIDEYAAGSVDIKRYYNSHNSGSAFKQWDYGIRKAQGAYVWIAESDDFADPCFLEKTSALLMNNENVGLVSCNSCIIDEQKNATFLASDLKTKLYGRARLHDYSVNGKKEILEHLFLDNTINNVSGVLFRKSSYIAAGFADCSMKYCGDWFLYIRILCIADFAYVASPLNSLRLHAGSSFHEYYTRSSYMLEFLRVYSFLLAKISLSAQKRLAMARSLLARLLRKIMYGGYPSFAEITETCKFLLAAAKPGSPV